MNSSTKLAVMAVLCGVGAAVAGCGNEVPPNGVAKVGDQVIKKSEFDGWLRTAAMGQAQSGRAVVPDPPEYTNCVASLKRQAPGQQGQTTEQLRQQCKQQYDQLKGEVMQFLIQAQWVQQEAKARGIEVSDAQVRRSFEDQKKQAFPDEKGYQRFLRTSGMSEEDILFRVKLDQLQSKLTQKVTENEAKVSDQDVRDYYDRNKRRFAQPERRDLRVVLTKTRPRALQARNALRRRQSWRAVARRYSVDNASKAQGGRLPDVAKGQQERALDEAVFKARRGTIQGPVKTQFGWYVFEVTKITPASQQSFGQAEDTIRSLLRSQRQQKALESFIKDFREEYKDKTECADGYVVAECKNAPSEKTETGPASGAPPQGPTQSPPGAPGPAQPPQVPNPQAPPPGPQPQGPASP